MADYTVQKGDTLGAIAQRYGTTWQALQTENNIEDPDTIYAGMKLRLPKKKKISPNFMDMIGEGKIPITKQSLDTKLTPEVLDAMRQAMYDDPRGSRKQADLMIDRWGRYNTVGDILRRVNRLNKGTSMIDEMQNFQR